MKEPTHICPLLAIAGLGGTNSPAMCLQDRCAWWDGDNCATLTLAFSLDSLNNGGIVAYPAE